MEKVYSSIGEKCLQFVDGAPKQDKVSPDTLSERKSSKNMNNTKGHPLINLNGWQAIRNGRGQPQGQPKPTKCS